MQRWHSERALMLRRAGEDDHRRRGLSSYRKKKPGDCGRARCGLCHSGKASGPRARATRKREAIAFELAT
jgi:hypothetical protein